MCAVLLFWFHVGFVHHSVDFVWFLIIFVSMLPCLGQVWVWVWYLDWCCTYCCHAGDIGAFLFHAVAWFMYTQLSSWVCHVFGQIWVSHYVGHAAWLLLYMHCVSVISHVYMYVMLWCCFTSSKLPVSLSLISVACIAVELLWLLYWCFVVTGHVQAFMRGSLDWPFI